MNAPEQGDATEGEKEGEKYVLPEDVLLLPIRDLSPDVRAKVDCEDGDVAISRKRSRTPSRIVDVDTAGLLQHFRSQVSIVDAVLRYSEERGRDPEAILEEAFPVLQHLIESNLLVPAESPSAERIRPSFKPRSEVAGFTVVSAVQTLEDTEVYRVRAADGGLAALKVLRKGAGGHQARALHRERSLLGLLDGEHTPRALSSGELDGRPYLVIEWCAGVTAAAAAAELRRSQGVDSDRALVHLAASIAEAYAKLHAQSVVHGDVHPRNVLVDGSGRVRLIDFGLARHLDESSGFDHRERGGVAFYFEPEYARARRGTRHRPPVTPASEQYAVAVMIYFLVTGHQYLDFSLQKEELYRQIEQAPPAPFDTRGVPPWPELERVLARALAKRPEDRFASMGELAGALRQVSPRATVTQPRPSSLTKLVDETLACAGLDGALVGRPLPTTPRCSVTYGAGGIAFALYRIACARGDADLVSVADVWCRKALDEARDRDAYYSEEVEINEGTVGQTSIYHCEAGLHLVQALISQAMGDLVTTSVSIRAFVAASRRECPKDDLTLGKASTLLGCALLLEALPEHVMLDAAPLRALGTEYHAACWSLLERQPAIAAAFELPGLGIAHGWAGILYACLAWARATGGPLPDGFAVRLDELASLGEPVGRGLRWPRKIRKDGRPRHDDFMASWCNGSPGMVFLWTLAHRHLQDDRYLEWAERGAWNSWEETNRYESLCCGLAGRAYALLSVYRETGDAQWLARARSLAEAAAAGAHSAKLRPNSLYKGDVGIALLAVEIEHPQVARMPLFEPDR